MPVTGGKCISAARPVIHALRLDQRGLALIEFAFAAPILLTLSLVGAELTNYAITNMRISEAALHLADHISRIGDGSPLQAKSINEADINDALTGGGLQAGSLDLYAHGRVIVSSLEPMANPNTDNKYKIAWQRCRGGKSHPSSYGVAGAVNLDGMGPVGRQVTVPEGGATIFVEIAYDYQPIVKMDFISNHQITAIAGMIVRDRRDTTQIYNNENAPTSVC